ncbi:MAG: substrate-binding domain-containing protein [Acidiferrobacterales bacterium]
MFPFKSIIPVVILAGFSMSANVVADENNRTITGAGAHFSWIVFKEQQRALEQHIHRPLKLFGKEQMLGAGCNAGIKVAQSNRPGHETFGLVCCPLSQQEIRKKALRIFPIAKEPILILVNRNNPVNNLSLKQVRDIFSGSIRNWKEVGGNDRKIVVVMRPHCKDRPGHWKTILRSLGEFRKDRVNVRSAHDMVSYVSDFDNAIGHTGSAWEFGKDSSVKAVTVSGYAPTAANIKSGKYPFFRILSAVTNKNPSKDVVSLIDFARNSDQFGKIARKYELLPLSSP